MIDGKLTETTRAGYRIIKDIWPVGSPDHENTLFRSDAINFRQYLVDDTVAGFRRSSVNICRLINLNKYVIQKLQ